MKKTVLFVSFALFVFSLPAFALDPQTALTLGVITTVVAGTGLAVTMAGVGPAAAMYLASTALIGGAAIGATAYFSQQPSTDTNKPYVATNGDVSKPANVTWVDLSSGVPTVKEAPVSAVVPFSALTSSIPIPPASSKYQQLQGALYKPGGGATLNKNTSVGSTVTAPDIPSGYGTVSSSDAPATAGCGSNSLDGAVSYGGYQSSTGRYIYTAKYSLGPGSPACGSGLSLIGYTQFYLVSSPPPPLQQVSNQQFAQNLAKTAQPPAAPAGVYSDFYGDVDNFIHDNPNVVHFDDGPASSVGSNPALNTPAGAGLSDISNAIASKSGQAAGTAQGAAVGAAQAAYNSYSSMYGKNNPLTQQAAATLAAQQAQQAQQAASQAADAAKQNDPGATNTPDAPKTLDLTPFNRLSGAMSSTFPFNLVGTVSGYYSAFVSTPTPPIFDYPMPLGFTIHIDLTPWDTLAQIVRYSLSVLLTAGAVTYVVHFWRGIS